jgi:hypothetical protein
MRFASDPQHLAICAGETIIHAYEAAGQCCEHRLSGLWESQDRARLSIPGGMSG